MAEVRPGKSPLQFRLTTLLLVVGCLAVPLAYYGNYLHKLRCQETAYREITSKGGTVLCQGGATLVDFSLRSEFQGIGVTCWCDRVLYPDFQQPATFGDADLPLLNDILRLDDVDFSGSKVTRAAALEFQKAHPLLSRGTDAINLD